MNRTLLHSAALVVALTSLLSSRFRSVADPIAAASYQDVTPASRDLFPAVTQVEKLADGFTLTEYSPLTGPNCQQVRYAR
jgi:hypothetical protein